MTFYWSLVPYVPRPGRKQSTLNRFSLLLVVHNVNSIGGDLRAGERTEQGTVHRGPK